MTQPLDQQRLRARERLLATLSHEIRTPLNGVLGMAGLLAGTALDATQTAYLQTLRDCGEHLLALVNDVLDYAKLDGQAVGLEPVDTDLEILLQGVCELLSPRAHAAGIDIAWAVPTPPPRIVADDGRLRQVLFNLAGNAVKVTRRGGVLLTAHAEPTPSGAVTVRLVVTDTGPGIPAEQQEVIFEEFVQAEAGEAAGGAGLGLAIVKRLADAFDGRLGVDSVVGHGARFWLEAEFPMAAPAPTVRPLQGVRVGIISRSATVRAAAAAQVSAAGGEAVTVTGKSAPAVDVVLVDPAGRGTPKPPLPGRSLILLAPEERRRIDPARRAGFSGYLIKPLRRASMVERVTALLGAAPTASTPVRHEPEDERIAATAPIGARVLLAEDNPVNALLARTLLTQAGCSVDRAATGEEAIAAAQAAPYDLVLMDVRMPGLSGMDAARRLREAGFRTPIVALTANAFEDDRRACLEAGMDDFLTKPLQPGALRAMLTRWVSPASAGSAVPDPPSRSAVG